MAKGLWPLPQLKHPIYNEVQLFFIMAHFQICNRINKEKKNINFYLETFYQDSVKLVVTNNKRILHDVALFKILPKKSKEK